MQQYETVVFLFDLVEFSPPFLLLWPQNVYIYFTGPYRCDRDTHKTEFGSLIFFILVLFGRRLRAFDSALIVAIKFYPEAEVKLTP